MNLYRISGRVVQAFEDIQFSIMARKVEYRRHIKELQVKKDGMVEQRQSSVDVNPFSVAVIQHHHRRWLSRDLLTRDLGGA
jgi:hypothetical protein